MATTKSLNSDDSIYVTTFYDGINRGRCYTFTANENGFRTTRTLTEDELRAFIVDPEIGVTIDDGIRPEFRLRLLGDSITQEVLEWCIDEVERQGDPMKPYLYGMVQAWQYGIKIQDERRSITEDDIHILAGLVKTKDWSRYRETPVSFADMSLGLPWEQIIRQMHLLIEHQHTFTADEFAKRFLDIHPFEDGNGRVAAILWNYINGTIEHPITMPDFYKVD